MTLSGLQIRKNVKTKNASSSSLSRCSSHMLLRGSTHTILTLSVYSYTVYKTTHTKVNYIKALHVSPYFLAYFENTFRSAHVKEYNEKLYILPTK